jgi:LPS-assembly lipoprotein
MAVPLLRATALCLVLAASGCGFHLRQPMALPEGVSRVALSAPDELTPFTVELRHGLERAGAEVTPSTGEADAVIRVRHDRSGRRVLSVSARNTPTEFEVFYHVEYSIERAGKEIVPVQRLELFRSFSFDESELLAKDREEELLREAMAHDLAGLVLRRFDTL